MDPSPLAGRDSSPAVAVDAAPQRAAPRNHRREWGKRNSRGSAIPSFSTIILRVAVRN